MASTLEKIASELADDTLAIMQKTGEDRLHYEVAKVLGASSQTLEEAYLTEVRVRLAGKAAKKFLKEKVSDLAKEAKAAAQNAGQKTGDQG
ncbi:hypothetical protein [Rhodalgimonas zhirmunskyi]|uniref:Uncharacterized protein n=1 Tax=Rhodalgimonas zhirmunskyi TaxID=2964767 RepID=A0AAJ1X370_9RHOB|nr:hypothetical protein [Rhodoalgimonas zhirmunskyi]MDQ2093023.1 hypothetical protein [Rhodoalgimonas zhirmunskyi]